MKIKFAFAFGAVLLNYTGLLAQGGVPGACNTPKDKSISVLNGNGTLGLTYSNEKCGLNYVQASVLTETRSVGSGFNANGTGLPTTLYIGSIPASNTILQAYVWYTVS